MKYKINLIVLWVLFAINPVFSQTMPQPEPKTTEYATREAELWGNYNMEFYQKDGSFWFAETNFRYSFFRYATNLPATPFFRVQQKLGYEKYLDKNWSLGFSVRGIFEKQETKLFTQLYLSHVSNISKQNIELIKNLSFERIDSDRQNAKIESRVTLGLALAKNFAIGGKPCLRPIISYEVFMMHYWLLNTHSLYNRRTFDMSRLRVELAYLVRQNLSISLYYMAQTEFFVAEPNYDSNGNELSPYRNLNITTPIFGLRVHLRLFNDKKQENLRLRFLSY